MLTPSAATAGGRSIVQRADTLALTIGSRVTVSTLMLACVLVIVVGANSMLASLTAMTRDMKVVNQQLVVTSTATDELNRVMDSLPPTSERLTAINKVVADTGDQVSLSAKSVSDLATATDGLGSDLDEIAAKTKAMGGSLASVDRSSGQLVGTLGALDRQLVPLVAAQRETRTQSAMLAPGIYGMNDRLGYVIRQLNYITAPPSGGPFTIVPTLDKSTLPPIPGLNATADPAAVFPRGVWPVYRGP